jgi:hypothetical protein
MTAGRPPKFDEPSSPVTVTLPSRILQQLKMIDSDRGKAIVKCVDEIAARSLSNENKVQIIKVSENSGLIVIGRCRCLECIPWLRLVEIAPARFMLSITPGTSVTSLEVAIRDLIENNAAGDDCDKGLLEELRQCISHHRRQEIVTKGEILFVALDNHKKNYRNWGFALSLQTGIIECLQFFSNSVYEGMIFSSCISLGLSA